MQKKRCSCLLHSIVPVKDVLVAYVIIDDDGANRFEKGRMVRTSVIVEHSIKDRTITTLNSIYKYKEL
jgi:hypothetical protein